MHVLFYATATERAKGGWSKEEIERELRPGPVAHRLGVSSATLTDMPGSGVVVPRIPALFPPKLCAKRFT